MTWTFNRWQILLCKAHSEITLKPCCSRVKPCMTGSVHQVRLHIQTCMLTLLPIEKNQLQGSCIHVEQRGEGKTPNIILFPKSWIFFMSNKKNKPANWIFKLILSFVTLPIQTNLTSQVCWCLYLHNLMSFSTSIQLCILQVQSKQ